MLFLVAFLCALWSPWTSLNISLSQLFGLEPPPQVGGLQVTALAGEVEVFVDGISQGKTKAGTTSLEIPNVSPGEHQVRLRRVSSVDGAYWEYNKLIKFESGIDVVLAYELGPSQEFSEGHLIFATKTADRIEGVNLNLDASANDADVLIDNVLVGHTPIISQVISTDRQHSLTIRKAGYESQEFKLLPDSLEDREKVRGYNLNVHVDLFLEPIVVN